MANSINHSKIAPTGALTILGAGSWGTALALHLSRMGQTVYLWTAQKEQAILMQKTRENPRYLPGHRFPASLHPTDDFILAIESAEDILFAVPSAAFRQVLGWLAQTKRSRRILIATKGLDEETGSLLDMVAHAYLGPVPVAVLSGPSFAKEVAMGLPTAVVIASHDDTFAEDLLKRFQSPHFRAYLSHDVTGVELGGVVKNALAIATGIADGMKLGANARAALITRGLAEMARLGSKLGTETETLTGLAGLGDLILTCTDDASRNRRFGLGLGQGKTQQALLKEIGQVIEGHRNLPFIMHLAKQCQVDMPIISAVWAVLQGEMSCQEAMNSLLARPIKR